MDNLDNYTVDDAQALATKLKKDEKVKLIQSRINRINQLCAISKNIVQNILDTINNSDVTQSELINYIIYHGPTLTINLFSCEILQGISFVNRNILQDPTYHFDSCLGINQLELDDILHEQQEFSVQVTNGKFKDWWLTLTTYDVDYGTYLKLEKNNSNKNMSSVVIISILAILLFIFIYFNY